MAFDCKKFSSWLSRRTDYDKRIGRDRFPRSTIYSNIYPSVTWPSFTGTTHNWDKVHVTRPNDAGCWETMNADSCAITICDPARKYLGGGTTRQNYVKYHQDYQSQVWCLDQLRHVEEAVAQLEQWLRGFNKIPDMIVSDFIRYLSLMQSDVIHIASSNMSAPFITVTTTPGMFTNGCTRIDLGSAANLPTSQLTMNYLDAHIDTLQHLGYFDEEYMEQPGKFLITSDLQTLRNLANQNPALAGMYQSADFKKGGAYYEYGVMRGVGDWLFKIDPEPLRFQHLGNGVLERIWPYQNVAATTGLKPQFDPAYDRAPYQAYHVYNRGARDILVGDISPVNPQMKFSTSRSLMGQWSWKSPDYFKATDPTTGQVCEFQNDKKNKGYFLGEFELGAKTTNPEIEMWIIAQRAPQCAAAIPVCGATPAITYQHLAPYNDPCPTQAGFVPEYA